HGRQTHAVTLAAVLLRALTHLLSAALEWSAQTLSAALLAVLGQKQTPVYVLPPSHGWLPNPPHPHANPLHTGIIYCPFVYPSSAAPAALPLLACRVQWHGALG